MRRAPPLAVLLLSVVAALPAAAPAADRGIGEDRATRIADRDEKVLEQRHAHGSLQSSAALVEGAWEVSYLDRGDRVALVRVDPVTGEVRESWTGYQVDWKMARGHSGAFGHRLNAPYVFLPLCVLFLIGLVDWRRPWRIANLDLLVLLAFGISHWLFNQAEIGLSVPLQYPVLLYLMARCLWIGLRGTGAGLRPVWPTAWLAIAALFLVGFRVGLNVSDSGVIDVGYASVVGADLIAHGESLYGNFPEAVSHGDTYGPVTYLAYLIPEAIWPWGGSWDDLPAAHGASVAFDLATIALLALLGTRLRAGGEGRRLAAILCFGWAAYPYTAFVLESNSNDALVAALLVATLLVVATPAARGALLALAALAKFAPLLLVPLLARAPAGGRSARAAGAFLAGLTATTLLMMLWPAIDPGLSTFFERTVGYQGERDSPFSVWGQAPSLEPLRTGLLLALLALSLLLALRPRHPTPVQLAALGAALLIGAQLTAMHWFYLYIVWFYPLLLVAFAVSGPGAPSSGRVRGSS